MTFPLVVTGIDLDFYTVGPFKSSAGNFYFFGRDASIATKLQCFKSADTKSGWSSVASETGYTTALIDICAFQVGDIIHLVICDGDEWGNFNYKYRTFNMATDAFVTSETIFTGIDATGGLYFPSCSIAVRSTGECVLFYQAAVNSKGNRRLKYTRRTGVNTWIAGVAVDDNVANTDYYYPVALLGNSDAVQLIYEHDVAYVQQKTLSASNVLGSAVTGAHGAYLIEGIAYSLSGTIKCIVATSTNYIVYFDAGDSPALNFYNKGETYQSCRLFLDETSSPPTVYMLYSKADAKYYYKTSTDGGTTWSAEQFIISAVNYGSLKNTSRLSKAFNNAGDIINAFLFMDNYDILKYNEKIVATSNVYIDLAAASATSAINSPAKAIQKTQESAAASSIATVISAPTTAVSIPARSSPGYSASLVAEGGSIDVALAGVGFPLSVGAFGSSLETEGGAARLSLTRLGPGGYPIASLPGGAGVPTTTVTLFSADSPAAAGSPVNYQLSFVLPGAVSQIGISPATWTNSHSLSGVRTSSSIASFGYTIDTAALSSVSTAAANEAFGISAIYWLAVVTAASQAKTDVFNVEVDRTFESIVAAASVGEFTPFAFTGVSFNLVAATSPAIAVDINPLNEIILPEAISYPAINIIRMEGDEAFNLAAAAAAGTVGNLLVAIVIPAAIKWLVCASIDIMPEVAGDLAMNAEVQATVIAAAALQGSPQLEPEVDGALEIAPLISGSPSMKEC